VSAGGSGGDCRGGCGDGRPRRLLLAPLDPVHDVGLKLIRRALERRGHDTTLMPPGRPLEEVVQAVVDRRPDYVLVGRTLGYDVAELLGRFTDLVEAAALKPRPVLVVGGMAVRPDVAAELGYDAGFGPATTAEDVCAYIEGRRPGATDDAGRRGVSPPAAAADPGRLSADRSYEWREPEIGRLADSLAEDLVRWATERTSPGVERARLRREWFRRAGDSPAGVGTPPDEAYLALCAPDVAAFHRRSALPARLRRIPPEGVEALRRFVAGARERLNPAALRDGRDRPLVFCQYGTGDPLLDIAHIKVLEAWGADGVIHFDPSGGAKLEGLLGGHLAHDGDGSLLTPDNLRLIRECLEPGTLWQVRAHRGLNTPETVVLAGELGAHLTKINICYAALGAGMDPDRIAVDGVEAMRLAADYGLPFDVVTNEELCGVPAHKAMAGMLVVAAAARRLGGRPLLQPLFCNSPQAMIEGLTQDNFIDFNLAKVAALGRIIDAPVWPGAPVGFLTHTEDRVQSALTTTLHALLTAGEGLAAVTIATTDEAYAGGPIAAASRVDTLRAVADAFRFAGERSFERSATVTRLADELTTGIDDVLRRAAGTSFMEALWTGVFGSPEDGAYPGLAGRDTVRRRGEAC